MVTITNSRGITLSANATINDLALGFRPMVTARIRGDFAGRMGGRIRRQDRREAIARKRTWLEG